MSQTSDKLIFIGDCIFDLISYVDRMPKMGETMNSNGFKYGFELLIYNSPGGKAANACVAASRLSSNCSIVTKLGDDIFGKFYYDELVKNKINTDYATFTKEANQSCASVMVDKNGYNAVVVNPGASFILSENDILEAEDRIKKSLLLCTNTMIKVEIALFAMKIAKEHNVITILNFSIDKNDIPENEFVYIDILVVNEVEAEAFSGIPVKSVEDAETAAKFLLDKPGLNIAIIITLGERGVVWAEKKTRKISYTPCQKVDVIDTTGAGDAFVGSLAHYILKLGIDSLDKCVELASAYATLTVKAPGTQASYPYLKDIDAKFSV